MLLAFRCAGISWSKVLSSLKALLACFWGSCPLPVLHVHLSCPSRWVTLSPIPAGMLSLVTGGYLLFRPFLCF